jgi:hypothetical protein
MNGALVTIYRDERVDGGNGTTPPEETLRGRCAHAHRPCKDRVAGGSLREHLAKRTIEARGPGSVKKL